MCPSFFEVLCTFAALYMGRVLRCWKGGNQHPFLNFGFFEIFCLEKGLKKVGKVLDSGKY